VVPNLAGGGVAYIVVQHLPPGFSAPLAEDLNKESELNVREASNGDLLEQGDMIFAKAGYHCVVGKGGSISLSSAPPLWGVRPSADITMASAAAVFGSRLIGVILTGMGRDGADGMHAIKNAGGITIAEHESSCVVYGMPRVAIELGVVDTVKPLNHIAKTINAKTEQLIKSQFCVAAI